MLFYIMFVFKHNIFKCIYRTWETVFKQNYTDIKHFKKQLKMSLLYSSFSKIYSYIYI